MALPALALGAVAIGAIVRWVFATIGLGIVAVVGLSALLTQLTAYINSLVQVPPSAANVLCIMQVQGMITILLSAYAVRIAMNVGKRIGVL